MSRPMGLLCFSMVHKNTKVDFRFYGMALGFVQAEISIRSLKCRKIFHEMPTDCYGTCRNCCNNRVRLKGDEWRGNPDLCAATLDDYLDRGDGSEPAILFGIRAPARPAGLPRLAPEP